MSQHIKSVTSPDVNESNAPKEEEPSFIDKRTEVSQLNVTGLSQNTSAQPYTKRNGVTELSPRTNLTFKQKIEKVLDSTNFTIFMSVITVYALFADDIRNLATKKDADDVWFSFATLCLFLFSAEVLLSCIVKKGYLWSFYFWLDFIATLSMIPDIGWIWYPIVGIDEDGDSGGDADQIKKAGRASKAGTRTSRVIRIIRLIRLIRIVKLYKNAQIAIKNRAQEEDDEFGDMQLPMESKVGKRLSDLTIKRVIVLVLLLLLILPLFDTEFYLTDPYSWDFGTNEMMEFRNKAGFDVVRQEYIAYHEDDDYPLIYFSYEEIDGKTYEWETDTKSEDLRFAEKYFASSDHESVAVFDIRYENRVSSGLNICRTVFVCIVLTLGAIYFTKDASELVITPIEKMMDKVHKIAKNPMMASEVRKNDIFELIDNKEKGCLDKLCSNSKENTTDYETTILEDTIIKIGVLLALGFGEAGSGIIATNMEKAGGLDTMLSGSRCMAVFGFCDIRNFTDSTEILLEGVMLFVNEIAQIVHGVVDHYQGAANKNIGDAFLLVWKFHPEDVEIGEEGMDVKKDAKRGIYLADCALTSFLKIIAKINRDPVILKYKSHEKLNKRMPNYAVKMGFGLHVGWAIEGAIGSEYKIDASYLSPHVNMASRLEAATKQYGVPFLLSGSIYDMLSPMAKSLCRHIDTITVKGSEKPVRIYTSDVDPKDLTPTVEQKERISTRIKRKKLRLALEKGMQTSSSILENSKELISMRSHITPEFISTFEKGMNSYIAGDWSDSKYWVEQALQIKPNDGPSETLMNVMAEEDFKAPSDWSGFRVLTEK